jgi:hypothetical protein
MPFAFFFQLPDLPRVPLKAKKWKHLWYWTSVTVEKTNDDYNIIAVFGKREEIC